MWKNGRDHAPLLTSVNAPLLLLAVVALTVGTVARFKGLGMWPLAWDEYYFARSVQYVLHSGLPQYPCGGYYARGLFLQYLCAGLQQTGMSPELAPRFVAALCSLITLPAVFLLARRSAGTNVALLAVSILAVSVWEVEIARFGRMYAPFQAVFAWYAVFFVEYTTERKLRALLAMLALSVFGVLVWEGGALLGLANFLPPFFQRSSGRLTRRDLGYLLVMGVLFIPVYWLATSDFRFAGGIPTLPADYHPVQSPSLSRLDTGVPLWHTLHLHHGWLVGMLAPLAVALYACSWLRRFRGRPIVVAGLLVTLLAALSHQFLLCGCVLLLMLLAGTIGWRELLLKNAAPWYAAILACLVYWIAFACSTSDWLLQPQSPLHTAFLLGYELARVPDLVRQIGVPWGTSLPVLGSVLAVLIVAAVIETVARGRATPESAVLFLLVALLLAAGAVPTERQETRYVFFLYPLAIVVAATAIAHAARYLLGSSTRAAAATALVCLLGFALTEDFRPGHLRHIDAEDVNFRIAMSPREAAMYPARSDIRAAARWLDAHVQPGSDKVIDAFPGVDFYYSHADFFFMDADDSRFEGWSCRAGSVERWGNLPLLYSVAMLDSQLTPGQRVWLVVETPLRGQLLSQLEDLDPHISAQVAWVARNPNISIVCLSRTADSRS
jgi:hypothetical protein